MPTDQKLIFKIDSRGLYNTNLCYILPENECNDFVVKLNNAAKNVGSYYQYSIREPELGEPIYIDDKFQGYFVKNLTDYLFGEGIKFRQYAMKSEPIGEHKFEGINCLPYKLYGRRKVFSIQHGSVNQILVKNLTGDDLVWINI